MPRTVERKCRRAILAVVAGATGCGHAADVPVPIPVTARSLAVAPDYAGTIWAASGGRVLRSPDGGYSWRTVGRGNGATGVAFLETKVVAVAGPRLGIGGFGASALQRRPAAVPIVAVASPYYRSDRLYGLDASGRLWLSVRNARRWARLRAAGLPGGCRALSAVRGDPLHPDVVYVACGAAGLWRSADFGASFRRLPAAGQATAVATTTDDQDRLLVADARGLLLSTDRGRSFRRVATVGGVSAVALDIRNYLVAFAAAGRTLLRSADGGVNWER